MLRFFFRHATGTVVTVVMVIWAVFLVPRTPSWAIVMVKVAIDARDGSAAAHYIDFPTVVRNAGYEMIRKKESADNPLGRLMSKKAVDLFSQPMADLLKSWAKRQVDEGNPRLQIPAMAVAAALLVLHRDHNTAYTVVRNDKGETWTVRLERQSDGGWQVVQVDNIEQFLQQLNNRPPGNAPPNAVPNH